MPELVGQMYCSQQIVIPPKFPYILKRFAKAAIKTQPYDLLRWSCEYFHALADGRMPPVKLRLEYPIFNTEGGLTRGYLRVLVQQLQGVKDISLPILQAKWRGACLDPEELTRIICMCGAANEDAVLALIFFAVAGGLLTKSLTQTMILLCETLTKEPEGGSATIPLDDFLVMYNHLARLDAATDCRYIDGVREGAEPPKPEEEQSSTESTVQPETQRSQDSKLRELSRGLLSKKSLTALETDSKGSKSMVAGRQMSTTSGEFIAQSIEREIMDVINEQIAILPDPDLKKKKAKPEEVAMIRELMETFLDENMEIIVPEQEAEEEEEEEQPEIVEVKAVPGIGAAVDENMIATFIEYVREVVKPQAGLIMPRNLRHFMCPPLELYLEPLNINVPEEVLAAGGAITE